MIIFKKSKYGSHEIILDDDIDFSILRGLHIQRNPGGNFYAKIRVKNQNKRLHRVLINAPNDKTVDHINGNTLDNRKINLRLCTNSENLRNSKKRKTNTSGYKGVSFCKSCKKYIASITLNYKKIRLGYFEDKKEAAIAYNMAAIKYHGNFAKLNEVE